MKNRSYMYIRLLSMILQFCKLSIIYVIVPVRLLLLDFKVSYFYTFVLYEMVTKVIASVPMTLIPISIS